MQRSTVSWYVTVQFSTATLLSVTVEEWFYFFFFFSSLNSPLTVAVAVLISWNVAIHSLPSSRGSDAHTILVDLVTVDADR
jgi:hypothetical protein